MNKAVKLYFDRVTPGKAAGKICHLCRKNLKSKLLKKKFLLKSHLGGKGEWRVRAGEDQRTS